MNMPTEGDNEAVMKLAEAVVARHWLADGGAFRDCSVAMSGKEARAVVLALTSEIKREAQGGSRDSLYTTLLLAVSLRIIELARPRDTESS